MRKFLFFLFVVQCICVAATAQSKTLSGKVTDDKGHPLQGVSVSALGASQNVISTTTTDAAGSFSLSTSNKAKGLQFSYVGMEDQVVTIGNKATFEVKLFAGNKDLSEVVVVAYGAQKKAASTSSVAVVKAADIENKPFTSVDKALQGSVAGLQSTSSSGAPGSATNIRIRGIGSINASAAPLWVIDGVIATTGDLTSNTTTANALSGLNPDDIESIAVLKDASATAIYGSRAANGVILVTTKKGKAGKTMLNFSGEAGKNSIAFKNNNNKSLNSVQTQTLLRESLINAGYVTNNADADALIADPTNGLGIPTNYTSINTNWLGLVTQTGNQGQYNLSLNGGNEKTQFYASGGYFDQQGTTIATDFKRYNGSLSITHKATDRATFSVGINGSNSMQHTPTNGGTFANPVLASFFLLPWYTPYNADGSLKYNDPAGEFPLNGSVFNPLVQAAWNVNQTNQTNLRGYVSGEYKILNNLKFTTRYSAEYFNIEEHSYRNPFYGDGQANGGDGFDAYTRVYDWTWSNFANWRQALDKNKYFNLNLTVGYEAQAYNKYLLEAGGQTFPQTLSLQYLASSAAPTTAYALPQGNATNSYFSTADITYKDLYVVSGSFRRDGSSVFGANYRWGNFYSVAGAWNINNEAFLKDNKSISLLKLRASYGETGNSLGFGNYSALPTYAYGANYTLQAGSYPSNVGNPNLTWEKNGILNIGLDFGILKNRLTGTVEYYDRKTSGLLVNVPLSLTSGFTTTLQNVGNISNKGIELTLGGKPIMTKNFIWDIVGTFTHNTNRVTALYQGKSIPASQFNYTVGHDLQEFYLRQWAGVDPANGDPLWYTDGTHSATTNNISKATISLSGKSASPKYYGSLTNTFSYKGFSLAAQLFYNFGNYVFDSWGSYYNSDGLYLASFNQLTNQLNRWQKPGDITNTPKIVFGGNKNSYRTSTRYLYKGDYIRLRDVQLSYAIPKTLLQKAHLTAVSLYVRGTNLFTFGTDKNIPFDPEAGITSTGDLEVFIPKTITGGIKISL
ncbi:SusC/RagA family TonB-linked outer membrane protein [Chitinophagaceae bacterium LWZ2-11]